MDDQNKQPNSFTAKIFIPAIILSIIFGALAGGFIASNPFNILGRPANSAGQNGYSTGQNLATNGVNTANSDNTVVGVVAKYSPAVVSVVATKDLPTMQQFSSPFSDPFFQQFFGNDFGMNFDMPQQGSSSSSQTQPTQVSSGTGFIVSPDGYVVTNKHVVSYTDVSYTVIASDGKKYTATVLGRDPVNDLAVLKINGKNLPTVSLGDSSQLKVGQSVIAIGNALGEFSNTVSTGVISGLSRSVTAGDIAGSEQLINVIQTDASINPGNSGGPLLDLAGDVIGINTAMAAGAQNIGFAIPINEAKNVINQVRTNGRIIQPWLGVRYLQIDSQVQQDNNLNVNYGALVVRGQSASEVAVVPGSPADKAGIVENDIILEIDGQKLDSNNPLNLVISKDKPGQEITLKVLHKGQTKMVKVTLEERKQ